MKLEEVGDDIYACIPDKVASGRSSSGLVDAGGGVVIDTQFDLVHAQQMLELFGRVWRRPPRHVVNTHEHRGHSWGNQLFPNAAILAHGLQLDGAEVHLIHVGPCHSRGDTLVHLPAAGVLFTGDVVCRDLTPLVTGCFENCLSVLDWIVELDPEVIVPGHGPVCGIEGVMDAKAYLAYVWLEAKKHFRAGRSALDAATRIELGTFAAWSEPERLYLNVEQAFRELGGAQAAAHEKE